MILALEDASRVYEVLRPLANNVEQYIIDLLATLHGAIHHLAMAKSITRGSVTIRRRRYLFESVQVELRVHLQQHDLTRLRQDCHGHVRGFGGIFIEIQV